MEARYWKDGDMTLKLKTAEIIEVQRAHERRLDTKKRLKMKYG
jgi:hypothetical protein